MLTFRLRLTSWFGAAMLLSLVSLLCVPLCVSAHSLASRRGALWRLPPQVRQRVTLGSRPIGPPRHQLMPQLMPRNRVAPAVRAHANPPLESALWYEATVTEPPVGANYLSGHMASHGGTGPNPWDWAAGDYCSDHNTSTTNPASQVFNAPDMTNLQGATGFSVPAPDYQLGAGLLGGH